MIQINEITPKIASFLIKISEGMTPKQAVELATIEYAPNRALELYYDKVLLMSMHSIFSFLNPQIDYRIKEGARLLQMWYLNFDALKDGELEDICKYLDEMKNYFKE